MTESGESVPLRATPMLGDTEAGVVIISGLPVSSAGTAIQVLWLIVLTGTAITARYLTPT